MHIVKTSLAALLALTFAASSAAKAAPDTAAAADAKSLAPADDADFMTGLRRVGVLAGQTVACESDADKQATIQQAMKLGDVIAAQFGLHAAFNFVGAVGFGSAHSFDKADCPASVSGWKDITIKYLH
jgi:hypothetical protein